MRFTLYAKCWASSSVNRSERPAKEVPTHYLPVHWYFAWDRGLLSRKEGIFSYFIKLPYSWTLSYTMANHIATRSRSCKMGPCGWILLVFSLIFSNSTTEDGGGREKISWYELVRTLSWEPLSNSTASPCDKKAAETRNFRKKIIASFYVFQCPLILKSYWSNLLVASSSIRLSVEFFKTCEGEQKTVFRIFSQL